MTGFEGDLDPGGYMGTDPAVWSDGFCRAFMDRPTPTTRLEIERWFGNAIEAGRQSRPSGSVHTSQGRTLNVGDEEGMGVEPYSRIPEVAYIIGVMVFAIAFIIFMVTS